MANIAVGRQGEDIAAEFLLKNGYKILERNKKFSRFCEIDIIAEINKEVVFVEVKTRRNNSCGSPFEAITKNKFENIKMGAMLYAQENDIKRFRIDAIAVVLTPKVLIKHLKNIYV